MGGEGPERPQRSDALRNRQRILEAAAAVFGEFGLEAGVGEIAARAEVGRGTLFRNFPTKQDLIAAIVVERMRELMGEGRRLLAEGDDAEMAFILLAEVAHRQQRERALIEAVDDEFLAQPEIRAAHAEFVGLVDELLDRGKAVGAIRPEVGALDVMMLVKGVCAAATALDASPELIDRHLDLVRAAVSTPEYARPLRGRAPTLADLEASLAVAAGRRRDDAPEAGVA